MEKVYKCFEIVPDAWHYPEALNIQEQEALVQLFLNEREKFYIPKLRSGHNMKLEMMCYGKHWNAKDYRYYAERSDIDNEPVSPLPNILINLAGKFNQLCFPEHEPTWDICIINHYKKKSSLGLHRDDSERQETLNSGHPVISFSVGSECVFALGGTQRYDPVQNILLKSGDVFVFGNSSRLRYHGVTKINCHDSPFSKFLDSGRLNFTLRKF